MKWMIRTGSTPAERARLRVVYALAGTVFFMPLNLFVMEGFFVMALLLGLYYMMRYPRLPLRKGPLSMPAVGFAVAAFLSLVGSPHFFMGTAFYVFTVLQYILLYYGILVFVHRSWERRMLFSALLFSAFAVALYGLYQYAHMLVLNNAEWVDEAAFPLLRRRMYSTLYNPNLLSAFLLIVMSASASMMICTRHYWHRVMYLVLLAILTLCLVLTYSRGAWLSVGALVFFFGLFWDKRVWLLFLAAPLIGAFYHGGVADRLLSIFSHSEADTSVAMRMDMWEAAIAMFLDHPLFGIGWGAFKHVYPVYNELIQEAGIVIFHAHNMYLNFLAETGLVGTFFGLWFFFGNAWYAIRYVKDHHVRTFDRSLSMTVAASVLSLSISGISDYDLFSTQISLTFWLMSALFANMFGELCEKSNKNSLRNNSQ